jgi:hypothetical protein
MKTTKQDSGYSELADAIINAPIVIPPKNSITIRFDSEKEAKSFYDSVKNANLINVRNYQILEIHHH